MTRMYRLAALALGACGDNLKAAPDAAIADASIDAPIDAPPQGLAPCLDRPTDLARPPQGQLPCEMLPPDFVAAARTAP